MYILVRALTGLERFNTAYEAVKLEYAPGVGSLYFDIGDREGVLL